MTVQILWCAACIARVIASGHRTAADLAFYQGGTADPPEKLYAGGGQDIRRAATIRDGRALCWPCL